MSSEFSRLLATSFTALYHNSRGMLHRFAPVCEEAAAVPSKFFLLFGRPTFFGYNYRSTFSFKRLPEQNNFGLYSNK